MKTIRLFYLLLAMAACSAMLCSFTNAQAQDEKIVPEMKGTGHQVIRLNYTFGVDPAKVTVQKGTTVIWMNSGRSIAKIKFTGKQVTLACKSPVHFLVDEAGSFTSNEIPQGAVASLCFVEKGTFDYTVTQEPPAQNPTAAPRVSKGQIIVE
jgi:plastocyanin